MKKPILIFLILIFMAGTSFAHPPGKIDSSYDNASGVLEIYISHKVADPKTHFIKEIKINVNGEDIVTTELSGQADNEKASKSYTLPNLTSGDVVIISATCNRIGRLRKKITIE